MNLFLATIYKVTRTLDTIIVNIQDLKQEIYTVIQTQKQGAIGEF